MSGTNRYAFHRRKTTFEKLGVKHILPPQDPDRGGRRILLYCATSRFYVKTPTQGYRFWRWNLSCKRPNRTKKSVAKVCLRFCPVRIYHHNTCSLFLLFVGNTHPKSYLHQHKFYQSQIAKRPVLVKSLPCWSMEKRKRIVVNDVLFLNTRSTWWSDELAGVSLCHCLDSFFSLDKLLSSSFLQFKMVVRPSKPKLQSDCPCCLSKSRIKPLAGQVSWLRLACWLKRPVPNSFERFQLLWKRKDSQSTWKKYIGKGRILFSIFVSYTLIQSFWPMTWEFRVSFSGCWAALGKECNAR